MATPVVVMLVAMAQQVDMDVVGQQERRSAPAQRGGRNPSAPPSTASNQATATQSASAAD